MAPTVPFTHGIMCLSVYNRFSVCYCYVMKSIRILIVKGGGWYNGLQLQLQHGFHTTRSDVRQPSGGCLLFVLHVETVHQSRPGRMEVPHPHLQLLHHAENRRETRVVASPDACSVRKHRHCLHDAGGIFARLWQIRCRTGSADDFLWSLLSSVSGILELRAVYRCPDGIRFS